MKTFEATIKWTQLVAAVMLTVWAVLMALKCLAGGNAFCAAIFSAMAAVGYFVLFRSALDEIRARHQDISQEKIELHKQEKM